MKKHILNKAQSFVYTLQKKEKLKLDENRHAQPLTTNLSRSWHLARGRLKPRRGEGPTQI